jgi:hypothetical protein
MHFYYPILSTLFTFKYIIKLLIFNKLHPIFFSCHLKKDENNFPLNVKMASMNPSINSKFDGLCHL